MNDTLNSYCCILAFWASRLLRRGVGLGIVLVLNIIHPLVHGTPLDGGLLDGLLAYGTMMAITSDD